ncbi:MAG: DEAD/DEAH box helicase [Candidatus Pacearchaeota archaeon]
MQSPNINEILKYLKDIKPREYQEKIFQTCREKNTLVILPTGLGKTLIALLLVIERQLKFPDNKILFLAPTRPLAEQHLNYFKKHLPEIFCQLELFTGKTPAEKRQELWQNADVIFSTPQCISNDLKNNLYNLNDVSLLIEDECHRCIKNYSYTYVAQKYKEQATNQRILGLTASPGHDKNNINQICKNLDIEAVEIRTRKSLDVMQYLKELNFNIVKLDFPEEFKKIHELIKIPFNKKIEELKNRNLLFGPVNKITLLECQHRIMKAIASGNKHFNLLLGASACAQALKLQHALELLETQTLYSLDSYISGLLKQADSNKSKAVRNLVKQPEFVQARTKITDLISKGIEHPKLFALKEIVSDELKSNKKIRILVFAQFRDTLIKICKELNSIKDVNAKVFVGQAKKGEGKNQSGLTQKEQQQIIKEFSQGKINVLCASSIGEEGLDIPEVNAVIFYEPVPSAIRKIQRAGRTARLSNGKLIILLTKNTRDESHHWSAFHKEKKMYKALENIKDNLGNINSEKNQKNLQEFNTKNV